MKQKDISSTTRAQILDAASRVVLDRGVSALTLEAAAQQAGISKGGLLYHFPSKNSLIAGMIERLIAEFDSDLEQELDKRNGNWLVAYIRASLKADPQRDQLSCALIAALANNPDLLRPLQERFVAWQQQAEAAAPSPEIGSLVRLALDGLWYSALFGFAPLAPVMRDKVLQALLKLAQGDIKTTDEER
ncbi:MAG: TetR family transcriptional regulator [Ktedonobacteraceae bacterium]|nr:TetR family transcriptional regulator [Ktedonobacteraceae bacterium]